MIRTAIRMVLVTMVLVALLPAAVAADGSPHISDECGPPRIAQGAPGQTIIYTMEDVPEADICSASFSSVVQDERPTILAVAVELAGEPEPDRRHASVAWTTGGCELQAQVTDTDEESVAGQVTIGTADAGSLTVRCGREEVPCGGTSIGNCTDVVYESEQETEIPVATAAWDGTTVTFTLDFADEWLAPFADLHPDGAELTALQVRAAVRAYGQGVGDFACLTGLCIGATTDTAMGTSYVVGS